MVEFNEIELLEKNGKAFLKIDNVKINGLTDYEIKRGTNMVDVNITISVPTENFKTIEN